MEKNLKKTSTSKYKDEERVCWQVGTWVAVLANGPDEAVWLARVDRDVIENDQEASLVFLTPCVNSPLVYMESGFVDEIATNTIVSLVALTPLDGQFGRDGYWNIEQDVFDRVCLLCQELNDAEGPLPPALNSTERFNSPPITDAEFDKLKRFIPRRPQPNATSRKRTSTTTRRNPTGGEGRQVSKRRQQIMLRDKELAGHVGVPVLVDCEPMMAHIRDRLRRAVMHGKSLKVLNHFRLPIPGCSVQMFDAITRGWDDLPHGHLIRYEHKILTGWSSEADSLECALKSSAKPASRARCLSITNNPSTAFTALDDFCRFEEFDSSSGKGACYLLDITRKMVCQICAVIKINQLIKNPVDRVQVTLTVCSVRVTQQTTVHLPPVWTRDVDVVRSPDVIKKDVLDHLQTIHASVPK